MAGHGRVDAALELGMTVSTGVVNPKRRMLSAICLICLREWVRALRGQGRK